MYQADATARGIPPILLASDPATVDAAVRVLRNGGIVAVPTDTVYGLVARYDSRTAVERIYRIKGRPEDRPLPILIASVDQLPLLATDIPDAAYRLASEFWPGPLTIILPALSSVDRRITAHTGTLGVRVPAGGTVLDLLRIINLPLASTSANLSGQPPAQSAQEIAATFGSAVDLVIDTGDSPASGRSSTVFDLTTEPPHIRRLGDVTVDEIQAVVGSLVAPSLRNHRTTTLATP
jgi:L-threonylcarbamoyladenylate synthase